MLAPISWLKDYVDIDVTPEKLAEKLVAIGFEVEGIEYQAEKATLVKTGRILSVEKHPAADRLRVAQVDVGGRTIQVVTNVAVEGGEYIAVALDGARLADGHEIKRGELRGVLSEGMLCGPEEIGLSAADIDGQKEDDILRFPEGTPLGENAASVLGFDDVILDVSVTANRPDCNSIYKLAKEVAVALGKDCREPEIRYEATGADVAGMVSVEVKNSALCPRYMAAGVRNVKIFPSPRKMRMRLKAVGIRPINNIVDITNFVLFELGQPLHAFDASKIEGHEIVVRTCAEGTPFVTLDGVERKLTANDLMICSAERPMCIAGVFGGLDSGISETTTDVFIESAYFNPVWVRKTAKRFGLNTDSSFRFERGVDPNLQIYAAKRAALLMKELAGGTISSDITDICPVPARDFTFDVSFARINALIGKELPEETVRTILDALEVKILAEHDGVMTVAVPPYRVDVQREADLIEDILRIYGYNNVEIPARVRSTLSYAPKPDRNRLVNLAADFLTDRGFTEIMSNSLTKGAYYEGLTSYPAEHCVRILNPLSADLNVLRQTLLFNMMEAIQLNVNRKNGDLKLYEFGNCYFYDASKRGGEQALAPYSEGYRLAVAVTGLATEPSWNVKAEHTSFFTLRAVAELLLRRFGIDIYTLKCETLDSDLFSEALSMSLNGKELLQIGSVSARVRRATDVKQPVYFMELNFDLLVKSTRKHRIAAEELSKYPEVKRDLALLVDKSVTFSALRDVAFAAERKLLKSVSLFDVYEGDKLPEGKKSYALSFILEDKSRTLDEKSIERVMTTLAKQFEQRCGAQIRA